jgi:tellurite methyltransferase
MEKTDTAHPAWDSRWRTDEGREDWLTPERDVLDFIPRLKAAGAVAVLDLGSGVGRHSLLLASEGFRVSAVDGSEYGIVFLTQGAHAAGLAVETVLAEKKGAAV